MKITKNKILIELIKSSQFTTSFFLKLHQRKKKLLKENASNKQQKQN